MNLGVKKVKNKGICPNMQPSSRRKYPIGIDLLDLTNENVQNFSGVYEITLYPRHGPSPSTGTVHFPLDKYLDSVNFAGNKGVTTRILTCIMDIFLERIKESIFNIPRLISRLIFGLQCVYTFVKSTNTSETLFYSSPFYYPCSSLYQFLRTSVFHRLLVW